MAKVLTTNFTELTIPFGDKDYTCYTYNNDIYIIARNYGIYKYDFTNKLFTLLYSANLSYKEGFLYNDILYIKTSSGINNLYTYITFSTYNITTNIYTSNVLTLTSNYRFSNTSSSYNNTAQLSTVNFYNNKIYVAGNGGRFWSGAGNSYWAEQVTFFIVYDLENNTYITNTTTGYCDGYVTTTINDHFFSIYYFNILANSVFYKRFGQLNTSFSIIGNTSDDFYAATGFEYEGEIYLLGGRTRTKKITKFNKQTHVFEDLTLTLPQDTRYDDITQVISGNNDTFVLFYPNGVFSLTFIDYDLTYKIANKTGEQEYIQLTEQSPITQVRFNYSGTGDVGFIFNTLSSTVSGTYTPNIPSGHKLVGFGSAPNTKIALAGLNADVAVTIDENFTFYEIYQAYKPPATTFEMNLYQNTAENNRVDKTNYLTSVGSINGALRSECSILRPSIIIAQDTLPTFNYVYIAVFGRYYFVTGITSVNFGLWRIELNTDVLMTYKNGITSLTAIIARQENDYNDNLIDTEIPTEKEPTITYQEIPNTVLNTQEDSDKHSFVITVVGN